MIDTIRVADIVGDTEVGERLGVRRETVAHWRSRYADFPEPIAQLGAGRQAPRGRKTEGTKVYDWRQVRAWAIKTGRMETEQ